MRATYEPAACPACGDAGGAALARREDVRRELERLWRFHMRRLRPGVPVSRLADRVVFSQDPPLRLTRCGRCGTVYRDPRDSARVVLERYRDAAPDAGALEALLRTQRAGERGRVRRLTALVGTAGRGVEIGCYAGSFLAAAGEAGWRFEGLDLNEEVLAHCRRQGLAAERGSHAELRPGDGWDAVALWTCLDQIPDPRAAVRAAAAALRPGGVLALRVPNGGVYAALRPRLEGRAGGLAERVLAWNNLLGFPYLQGFTAGALAALADAAGLGVVQVRGSVLVRLSDRWTRRWAALEERVVKAALGLAPPLAAPWIELYARRPLDDGAVDGRTAAPAGPSAAKRRREQRRE